MVMKKKETKSVTGIFASLTLENMEKEENSNCISHV